MWETRSVFHISMPRLLGQDGLRRRWPIAQCRVRPFRVVFLAPPLRQNLCLLQRLKDLAVQKLVSQLPVEALTVPVFTVRDRIRLRYSGYDCGVRWRNSLNCKLSTGHGSEYSWQRPRSEAQKKSKDKLSCSSHLTIHDRPPHAGLAILLLVFACGVHNGDLLFFCFFSAHNPVRELSMGCAQV